MSRPHSSGTWIAAPLNHQLLPGIQWIEASSFFQIPSLQIVGLPSREVSESRERIRSAIESSGLEFPRRRIVLNLSPANVRKRGTGLDLAMAMAVLSTTLGRETKKASQRSPLPPCMAWGELGLDGTVKPAGQALRVLYAAESAGIQTILLAREDYGTTHELMRKHFLCRERARSIRLVSVKNLQEAWEWMNAPERVRIEASVEQRPAEKPEVRLQEAPTGLLPLSPALERALGAAASGLHHLLLLGPKGVGKTHALEWLIAVLPEMSSESRLLQGLMHELRFPETPVLDPLLPVRRVSTHVRPARLCGGADVNGVLPGEFSLAHGGLLIADEFPEWPADSRECLREPLERGRITLSRTRGSAELPADFVFAATGNLCPCGGWPEDLIQREPKGRSTFQPDACRCSPGRRRQYELRLSGPITDRMGIVLKLGAQNIAQARNRSTPNAGERVRSLRDQALRTRRLLLERYGEPPGKWSGEKAAAYLQEMPELETALEKRKLSSLRARHQLVRLAVTLAAWDGLEKPSPTHLMEAASYRSSM